MTSNGPDWDTIILLIEGGILGFVAGWFSNQIVAIKKAAERAAEKASKAEREVHEVSEMMHHQDEEPRDDRPDPPEGEPLTDHPSTANLTDIEQAEEHRGAKVEQREQVEARFNHKMLVVVLVLAVLSSFFTAYYNARANNTLDDVTTTLDTVKQAQKDLDADQAELKEQQAAFQAQIECQQEIIEDVTFALKARSTFSEQQAQTVLDGDKAQLRFLLSLTDPDTNDAEGAQTTSEYIKALRVKIQAGEEALQVRDTNPYPTRERIKSCGKPQEPATE